ncbi:MAG: single-stranded-DNA-specific exonuclease RecJ [Candidatus Omnitrophica bacterium]|nr:single-stranded-DNA-specific exonuclease RecJ [Candidatus Omnitrophota bacterium]
MANRHTILTIAPPHPHQQKILTEQLGISKLLAQVLINRGITTPHDAEQFLKARLEHLLSPYAFKDMRAVVSRIQKAANSKEQVLVHGDYDVDGITSLALLKNSLHAMGINARHHLPHRVRDGYGLNKNILSLAKETHTSLVITADCGTNDHDLIQALRDSAIDVIVTDHHELSGKHPAAACAVINPKVKDSGYAYRDLAGVGVAFKVCQALSGKPLFELLDLVSLGTIADVAPLTGENRIFVKEGLAQLGKTKRKGLKALMESSGIKNKAMNATMVSYVLGPRLNASGRVDTAQISLDLLMTDNDEEAARLARLVESFNRQRQKEESKIMEEAQDLIAQEINFKDHSIIVLAKDDWHQGVLGVVASKLADKFYRPTIIISLTGDHGKGSGRSIKNFHLFSALCSCKDLLKNFGGHSHAAGLSIARERIDEFKKQINRFAKDSLRLEDLLPSLEVDAEVTFEELDDKIVRELEALQPHGEGNPEPLLFTRNVQVKRAPQVLSRNTLKFLASDGKATRQVIGFGMGEIAHALAHAKGFDLVFTPRIDSWQGQEGIIFEAKDIFLR